MWFRRKQPRWVPNQDLDDSVLVWMAVEPLLPKKLGRVTMADAWLSGGAGNAAGKLMIGPAADELYSHAGPNPGSARMTSDKAPYQLAALRLTDRLTEQDRTALRAQGRLPDWFLPELKKQAKTTRSQLRRNT
jgi:hypothetical protein